MRCALTFSALVFCASAVAEEAPIPIGTRLELFADKLLVERLSGSAAFHVQQPEAREVVLVTDQPWEGNTCAYYTIFQDGDRFRMYYRGSHFDETTRQTTHREVTCYAESRDGIHWSKPDLGLFAFDDSTKNNIVWDGIGTHCFTVFKDANPACPPEARYKAISRGRPQAEKGLYVFQSPDGLHWSLLHDGPVITEGAFDSQNLAFWDPSTEIYRAFYRVFEDGLRAIMTATSKDFVHWSEPNLVTYGDAPNEHLYTNAVQPYARAPHLLLGFPTRYLPAQGERVEPTFMVSRDHGRTFHRWPEPVIPETAPRDRGGNRSNYMGWGLLALPDEPDTLSVYASEAYYTGPDSRLRRFTYRLDGFVSIRATQTGSLLTKTIVFEGDSLHLNHRIRENGVLRVELQDAAGSPIDGFTLEACRPMTGDALQGAVRWASGRELAELAGQPVRMRFEWTHGDVFAFRFGE